MKKKFLSVVCIVLALLQVMLFAGCRENSGEYYSVIEYVEEPVSDGSTNSSSNQQVSSNNTSNSSQATSSKDTVTTTNGKTTWQQVLKQMPKNLRGTTVEYFTFYPQKEIPGVSAVIKTFEKTTGVKVKWTVVDYKTYDTELNARMAANNAPDVVFTQGMVFSRMQHFVPLSDINFDFTGEEWDKQTMKDYTIKGKAYATNLSPDYTYMHQPQAMFYNKNLISKYDFEDPYKLWKNGKWTFNKMLEMVKMFKEETGNYGFSFAGAYEYAAMKGICAGPFTFDGKKVSNSFKTNNIANIFQQMSQWKEEGILSTKMLDEGAFYNQKMLFYTFNFGTARYTNSHCYEMKVDGSFGVVPLPAIDGQSTYYQPMGEYEGYCIPKGAKNAEAVPYFLRCVFDKSNYDAKKFFCSSEALEVYNWAMKQKRVMSTHIFTGQSQTNSAIEAMGYELWGTTAANVPTTIATSVDTIDLEVKKLNEIIK